MRAFSMVAYLVPDFVAPLDHLGDSLIVHLPSRFTNRIDDCEVGLQCVERRDSVLVHH